MKLKQLGVLGLVLVSMLGTIGCTTQETTKDKSTVEVVKEQEKKEEPKEEKEEVKPEIKEEAKEETTDEAMEDIVQRMYAETAELAKQQSYDYAGYLGYSDDDSEMQTNFIKVNSYAELEEAGKYIEGEFTVGKIEDIYTDDFKTIVYTLYYNGYENYPVEMVTADFLYKGRLFIEGDKLNIKGRTLFMTMYNHKQIPSIDGLGITLK